jgi:DNA repair protein RadC
MEFTKILEDDRPFAAWPWRILNQAGLFQLVNSLSRASHEAMLAFYVTKALDLLAIDIVGKGSISNVKVNLADILCRGRQLGAGAFLLVHNHPGGNPKPSQADIRFTNKMRRLSNELDLPLLDHFVISGSRMERVGDWL